MRPSVQGGSADWDARRGDGDLGPLQNAHFLGDRHQNQEQEGQKFHDLGLAHAEG